MGVKDSMLNRCRFGDPTYHFQAIYTKSCVIDRNRNEGKPCAYSHCRL